MKSLKWRIMLILLIIGLSIFVFLKKGVNLGLDLKGGMHLILEVQTDEALRIQTDQAASQLREQLKEADVKFESVSRKGLEGIEIIGTVHEEENRIKDILDDDYKEWNYASSAGKFNIKLRANVASRMREQSVDQALETIRNRVDEFGVSEPVIQKEGVAGDRILVQLPGVDDPDRVKNIIQSTAMLEFKGVVDGPFASKDEALKQYNGKLPSDYILLPANKRRMREGWYVLKAASVVTGNDLKNARSSRDGNGSPAVGFSFNSKGARKFERYTSANIKQRLSIVLDNKVESVATIEDVISYDGILRGNYSYDEVNDMVLVLKSGALPAPLTYLQERTIGPSLGADSIRKGVFAALIGLVLVVVFMLLYYKGAGINSVIALIFNILILLGILSAFGATLTLPGIAGIILTIGMAVDANVLVFERIKEDLAQSKSVKKSIEEGFSKAFVTILDANLTTVIAAIFLFQFGTGPIKGFSVTLIVGVLASMFTSVFVSRVIFDIFYGKKKNLQKISI